MYLSIYPLSALVNVITTLFLGFFIYLKRKENPVNRAFFWFCIVMIIWSGGYFFWQISNSQALALFWSRVLMAGAIFIPITYLVFLFILTNEYEKKIRFIIFSYLIFALFFLLNFTPYFVKEVEPELWFKFWPKAGEAYGPFLLIWFFYVAYTFYFLTKRFFESKGVLHTQLGYVLFGTIIGYLGGATNYFLWYGIHVPPLGNGMITVYMLLVAFAIVKYHLFDIRVITTEVLVALIGLGLLINVLFSKTILEGVLKGILFILVSYGGLILIRSVKEEIKHREEVVRLNFRLKELDKLKDEFLQMATHELNTPIAAIKGRLSMALEENMIHLDNKQKAFFWPLLISLRRLTALIADLLDVSRIEGGRLHISPKPFAIEELIQSVLSDFQERAKEKNLNLIFENPKESLPLIFADPDKTRQILTNLISNGIKFTEKGGVKIEAKEKDGEVLVSVSDTGIGIDKKDMPRLFGKFQQINREQYEQQGSGLGLYIAKSLTELQNGKIWAESAGMGRGSTFYFTLPVIKKSIIKKEQDEQSTSPISKQGQN